MTRTQVVAAIAAVILGATGGALLILRESPPPRRPDTSTSPAPSPTRPGIRSDKIAAPGRCPYPEFRPTYLPWAPEGPIPRPRKSYDRAIDRAQLVWVNPADPDDGVAVTVYPLPGGTTPEEPIGVRLDGAVGYLHQGSVGEHSAWWNLDRRCNFLELSVGVEGLSAEEMDAEVIKVARSLR